MEEHYIQLDLIDAPPTKYKYAVGNRVPLTSQEKKKSELSYFSALNSTLTPTKVGIATSVYADRVMRAFDSQDSLENVDPSFKPFEVWKENGHAPEEYAQIGQMKNWEQYNFYKTMRDYESAAEERLADSGATGNIAAFAAQIGSDPTVLFGFGAARMLSKGMAASKALAISGAAGSAAYEAQQQYADVTDKRTEAESLLNIGASAVIGGALGKGLDVWKGMSAAGKIKESNFNKASVNYIKDADSIVDRSLSAAVPNEDMSKISGAAARFGAYSLRRLAPKLLAQTSSQNESRLFGEKFFGRTLKTEGDVAGLERAVSMLDNHKVDTAKYLGKIRKFTDEINGYTASGKTITEADRVLAIRRASDPADTLSDGTASSFLAQRMRPFFDDFAKEMEGMSGFNYRQNYVPMIFNTGKINQNFKAFRDKFVPMFIKAKEGLKDDLLEASNRLTGMIKNKASADEIADLEDEIRIIRSMLDESPDEAVLNATNYASKFADGSINQNILLNPLQGKILPQRFKQRMLDINTFADFIENNPVKLQYMYMREVMPFLASQKTFGARTPKAAMQEYVEKIEAKRAEALQAGNQKLADKLSKERDDIVGAVERGWDDLTGMTQAKGSSLFGPAGMNIVTSAKNYIAASSLGAVILASLNELNAIAMAHGLKGLGNFYRGVAKMATSKELRQMAKRDAYYMSHAINTSVHKHLADSFADETINMSVMGSGITAKMAKASQAINHWSQYINGNVAFTSGVRSALAVAQQGILKNSLEELVNGTISQARKADLAFLGISSKQKANAILKQAAKYGEEVDGVFSFNLEAFDNKELSRTLEIALTRDNTRASLNPDVGDVPHLFHVPGANLFTQFKSWGVAAGHTYGLSALQRADAEHLMGVASFVGLSSAAYILAEYARGNEPPTDADEIIYSGITNSGLLGVLPDYGGHYLMNKIFDFESGGAKFAERQDVMSTFMGPLGTKLQDVQSAIVTPLAEAVDPNRDVEFDDTWAKNMLDILPMPFFKPYIKNELMSEE